MKLRWACDRQKWMSGEPAKRPPAHRSLCCSLLMAVSQFGTNRMNPGSRSAWCQQHSTCCLHVNVCLQGLRGATVYVEKKSYVMPFVAPEGAALNLMNPLMLHQVALWVSGRFKQGWRMCGIKGRRHLWFSCRLLKSFFLSAIRINTPLNMVIMWIKWTGLRPPRLST